MVLIQLGSSRLAVRRLQPILFSLAVSAPDHQQAEWGAAAEAPSGAQQGLGLRSAPPPVGNTSAMLGPAAQHFNRFFTLQWTTRRKVLVWPALMSWQEFTAGRQGCALAVMYLHQGTDGTQKILQVLWRIAGIHCCLKRLLLNAKRWASEHSSYWKGVLDTVIWALFNWLWCLYKDNINVAKTRPWAFQKLLLITGEHLDNSSPNIDSKRAIWANIYWEDFKKCLNSNLNANINVNNPTFKKKNSRQFHFWMNTVHLQSGSVIILSFPHALFKPKTFFNWSHKKQQGWIQSNVLIIFCKMFALLVKR